MKVKLYKVHNMTKNKWYCFKDIEKVNNFIEQPINYKNEFKVYVIYEPEKKMEQLKFNI